MEFSIDRDDLLSVLQPVASVVEKKKNLPILSNVLIRIHGDHMRLFSTDLEVELIGTLRLSQSFPDCVTTTGARKLLDVCRSFPEESLIHFTLEKSRLVVASEKSRYTFATLPAEEFPRFTESIPLCEWRMKEVDLLKLFQKTHFSIAQQDFRYFLNGLHLELSNGVLTAVATDGHRLSMTRVEGLPISKDRGMIVPRKAVLELMRLFAPSDREVLLTFSEHHLKVETENITFLSKAIDGKYPDVRKLIPEKNDKSVIIPREPLKKALLRASLLANDRIRGLRLSVKEEQLCISAHNTEQEEAIEVLPVEYKGPDIEYAVNASYLLDVLNTLTDERIECRFFDAVTSLLIHGVSAPDDLFLIMPMRI